MKSERTRLSHPPLNPAVTQQGARRGKLPFIHTHAKKMKNNQSKSAKGQGTSVSNASVSG